MQSTIIAVSPFRCRMWPLHDRLECHVNEETCRSEIESFSRQGQLVPVLGRPLRGDLEYDVELIYGARRLFVARHINKPLLVEIRELGDRDALIAMDIENRQRTDISPYERGLSYARWLRSGHFKTQDEIARALRVSSSQVSRLLKLARLPSVIIGAFNGPLEICEGWGLSLIDALDDPKKRDATLRKARAICSSSAALPAREVYRELLRASVLGAKPKSRTHDEVIKDVHGAALFRIRQQRNSIALVLPVEKMQARVLDDIRRTLASMLRTPPQAS